MPGEFVGSADGRDRSALFPYDLSQCIVDNQSLVYCNTSGVERTLPKRDNRGVVWLLPYVVYARTIREYSIVQLP